MSERTHHQLHSPESDPKFSGGAAPGEKTGLFHAPPKPGALDSIQTGQIEPVAPTQDPSVGLLETLQAVKDKQQGGSSAGHEVSDISGVQTRKSAFDRLMNAQTGVFGAATLILVLSVWGLIHLADQATKNIGKTETPSASSANTAEQPATSAAIQSAAQPAIQPQPPVTQAQPQAPKPTLKAPTAMPAQTPGAIKQQNAAAIQAEKERLAREEQERAQREKEREEEDKRERERQLRELEGAGESQDSQPPQNPEAPPPPNPDAVPPPNPENG